MLDNRGPDNRGSTVLVIEIGEDCLGICTSARTSEKKTIDSPSVATPKVELWLLLTISASMTPDIISHKTDRLLTPILGAYSSSRGAAVSTPHSPSSPASLSTYKQRAWP